MATAQTVWGIDVGRSALKAIKLRAGADGKVEILAHDYIEHEKILSERSTSSCRVESALRALAFASFHASGSILPTSDPWLPSRGSAAALA